MAEELTSLQLHCFIASAFGYSDIDQIYDNGITKALSNLNIIPHRVDRENHNDDIDDKIIELLNTCDICIADLTYSRPSVYYEAGYFKGLGKQVIFTVRRDHFKPNPDDNYGNFRVHFDLQMKNIISWNGESHLYNFIAQVEERLKLIAEPLLVRHNNEIKTKKKTEQFGKLSPEERKNAIYKIAKSTFEKDGKILVPHVSGYLQPRGYLAVKHKNKLTTFFITQSATKAFLKYISGERILEQNANSINDRDTLHIIIISLRNVPISRIEDLYSNYRIVNDQIISLFSASKIEVYNKKEVDSYIHILSGLYNLDEYETRLKMIFDI